MAKKKTEGRLKEHLIRIKERVPFAIRSLEAGMLAECRYTDLKGQSGRQLICILNPYHYGKVHAISLDKVTYNNWNRWVGKVGLRAIDNFPELKALDIPKLQIVGSPRTFYKGMLKVQFGSDTYGMADSYRTYLYGSMKGIQVVNYKFNSKLEEQWKNQQI